MGLNENWTLVWAKLRRWDNSLESIAVNNFMKLNLLTSRENPNLITDANSKDSNFIKSGIQKDESINANDGKDAEKEAAPIDFILFKKSTASKYAWPFMPSNLILGNVGLQSRQLFPDALLIAAAIGSFWYFVMLLFYIFWEFQ